VKKETCISAQAFIHDKMLDAAKRKVSDPSKSIHQVSFELGFKYPQHFTRLFKQKVGLSPNEYRNLN
jgi:AraC-like DNA-binding protein